MTSKSTMLASVVLGALVAVTPAGAALFTLVDANTSVTFDIDSPVLQSSWTVDGRNYLKAQSFWYRLGDTGGELPVSSLGPASALINDTNGDGLPDRLQLEYGPSPITVKLVFPLTGGLPGSGWSSMTETITIKNTGQTAQNIHFFQYADFDLGDALHPDTITIEGRNTARQTSGPLMLSETVDTPGPTNFQADVFSTLIDSLGDGGATVLGGQAGPVTGDATWAFEWEYDLAPGADTPISKVQHLEVPEPATLVLMAAGMSALVKRRRRKHGR